MSFRTKNRILIFNNHPTLKPPLSHRSISQIAEKVFKEERRAINSLCISFLDDKALQKVNRKFLKHDYLTDTISFVYDSDEDGIDGEILIGLEKVKQNAAEFGSSYKREFERVLIHSCLHVSGYEDKTKSEKEMMRRKENYYLGKIS